MRPHEFGELTMQQFNAMYVNIAYVLPESKNFGDPPDMELPSVSLTRYADRCGVAIPYEVHLDLLSKGNINANETDDP